MIKRIVKLTFREEEVDHFREIFSESKQKIANSKGCLHVELLQQINQPNVFFTYSFWESEEALNLYRNSELFEKVWKRTKALFADKPKAWSVKAIE